MDWEADGFMHRGLLEEGPLGSQPGPPILKQMAFQCPGSPHGHYRVRGCLPRWYPPACKARRLREIGGEWGEQHGAKHMGLGETPGATTHQQVTQNLY